MLPRGMLPPGFGGVGSGSPPNLAIDHTVYELCLPSESNAASFGYTGWKLEESVNLKVNTSATPVKQAASTSRAVVLGAKSPGHQGQEKVRL